MSTVTTWQTKSASSGQTEALGERLGKALKGGEVIELASDLGGGKTTFTRGLARGAGSSDRVASPTFTISKVYDCKDFEIHHFDFYRLGEAGIVGDELAELVHDPGVVVIVEWGDVAHHVLPDKRLTLRFTFTPDGMRKIEAAAPKGLEYLVEAMQ